MGPLSPVLVVLMLAGCAAPISQEPVGQAVDQLALNLEVRGPAPILGAWLPLPTAGDGVYQATFSTAGVRLDNELRPRETLELRLLGPSGDLHALVYLDRHTLGVVQVLLMASELGEDFREQVIVRDGSEPSCAWGSMFLGEAAEAVEVAYPGGERIVFESTGEAQGAGRPASNYRAAHSRGTVDLTVARGLPCPLAASMRSSAGEVQYEVRVLDPPRVMYVPPGASPPGGPLVAPSTLPPGPAALIPDGDVGDRFPLAAAYEAARQDEAFSEYLRSHPAAELAEAHYGNFDSEAQDYELWQMTFGDESGSGYRIDVHRRVLPVLAAAPLYDVVKSDPEQIPAFQGFASRGTTRTSTLGYYLDVQERLWPDVALEGLTVSFLTPAPTLVLAYPRERDLDCTLLSCAGLQTRATITFSPLDGHLIGFSGGFDAWERAQPAG